MSRDEATNRDVIAIFHSERGARYEMRENARHRGRSIKHSFAESAVPGAGGGSAFHGNVKTKREKSNSHDDALQRRSRERKGEGGRGREREREVTRIRTDKRLYYNRA